MSISMNYIEFINENNKFSAKIHKDGKVLKLQNPNNVKKLLEICHKHKILLNGKNILRDNVNPVIKEFDEYFAKAKKRRQKLQVIGQILDNMSLKKENKAFNKKVAAASLATIIGLTSIGVINANKKQVSAETPRYEEEMIIEEDTDYIAEDISIYQNDPSIELQYAVNSNIELQNMMEPDAFHFAYEDRTSSESLSNARRYEDLFEKYGNMYGVDKNLLMAISAQENAGRHYENLNGSYATGIMQIERSANLNSTISAYNFETGEVDSIEITQEKIEDLETNIQIGTMILRNRLQENNFNIPLSLQSYNFGYGNMSTVLNNCCQAENLTREELRSNITNPQWLNYRTTISVGDPLYIEHVFSYIPNNTTLTFKTRDGNNITLQIVNDNVNNYQMT